MQAAKQTDVVWMWAGLWMQTKTVQADRFQFPHSLHSLTSY